MVKISYGESNFEKLVRTNSLYIDRTNYLEVLEDFFSNYLVFLRPRRFGKSLFISLLEYYYGIQYKDKFDYLFGQYYIGQNPTPLANQYLILKFDFSQIDTSSFDRTFDGFLHNAKNGAAQFYGQYQQFFNREDIKSVKTSNYPAKVIQHIIETTKLKAPNQKIYLLIDEYDHFANEILSFLPIAIGIDEFTKMVGQNGFVRKFYEAIKVGTGVGIIDKLFITGISPLTLDSFTSGFNISTNITLREEFNEMMGFTKEEVIDILQKIEVQEEELDKVLNVLREWYEGYKFSSDTQRLIYNPDMILYFISTYCREKTYPHELLSSNIYEHSYNKISSLLGLQGKESPHFKHLEKLLTQKELRTRLLTFYDLTKQLNDNDFIRLLFYYGIITIVKTDFKITVFRISNYAIKELCFKYYHNALLKQIGAVKTNFPTKKQIEFSNPIPNDVRRKYVKMHIFFMKQLPQ